MTGLGLTLLLLMAAPAAPSDADTAKAKAAFGLAQQLYKQARYLDAVEKFEEAYRLKPHPSIFFNIGRCYEQLGEITRALRSYRDYLKALPDAKDKDTVAEAILNLERRMKDTGRQQVSVTTDPPGASVSIDGTAYGVSPTYVELKPGNHMLKVALEGHVAIERNFVMPSDKSMELAIALKPAPSELKTAPKDEPVAKAEPKKESDVPKKEEPAKVSTTPEEKKPADSGLTATAPGAAPKKGRLFTWVAAGVAVAGLGAGIGMGAAAGGASAEMLSGAPKDQPTVQGLHDRAQGLSTGANISYVVAGAAAITAVILFFVEGGPASPPPATATP